MLYNRGRPTSIVLLLLMVVAQFALPLSCHSPLCLHHLLCLVGSARRLVSLGGIEVLQTRAVAVARLTAFPSFTILRACARRSSAVCKPVSQA